MNLTILFELCLNDIGRLNFYVFWSWSKVKHVWWDRHVLQIVNWELNRRCLPHHCLPKPDFHKVISNLVNTKSTPVKLLIMLSCLGRWYRDVPQSWPLFSGHSALPSLPNYRKCVTHVLHLHFALPWKAVQGCAAVMTPVFQAIQRSLAHVPHLHF